MIATGRPCTRPIPVTTPSAGRSGTPALAKRPSSTKSLAPSSHRSAMRSRQNSLPAAAFASWYLGAPPFLILSASAFSSSLRDMRSLSSFVVGGPLLCERRQPFVAILAGEDLLVALRLQRQPLGQPQRQATVDGPLRRRGRQRRRRRDLARQCGRRLAQRLRRDHLGDQPQ